MNESMRWVDEVRGVDSLREVARKIGTTHSTLARQINGDQLTFDSVREIARAYRRPVLSDLMRLNFLSAQDAGMEGVERALSAATDEQLVIEIARRLDVTPSSMLWDAPVTEAVERAENVTRLEDHRFTPVDDERAVASEISDDDGSDEHYDD